MATMALLLLIEEGGWQATLWGNFRNDEQVLAWAGVQEEKLFGFVLVGGEDGLNHLGYGADGEGGRVGHVLGRRRHRVDCP